MGRMRLRAQPQRNPWGNQSRSTRLRLWSRKLGSHARTLVLSCRSPRCNRRQRPISPNFRAVSQAYCPKTETPRAPRKRRKRGQPRGLLVLSPRSSGWFGTTLCLSFATSPAVTKAPVLCTLCVLGVSIFAVHSFGVNPNCQYPQVLALDQRGQPLLQITTSHISKQGCAFLNRIQTILHGDTKG